MLLVWSMGWTDFASKYRGSILGYLWSFMVPLMRFLVIYFVFEPFVGSNIPHYPLYLFLGIILWEHFSLTTTACLAVPFEKSTIVQNVKFPRWLLLPVVGWMHIIIFLTHFAIFVVFALLSGMKPTWSMWYMLIILVQMTFLALGVGGVLGAFVLRFRDLRHLWDVLLTVLFWLTPIMYPYRLNAPIAQELLQLPQRFTTLSLGGFLSEFVRFQPISVVLFDARRSLLYADVTGAPSLMHAAGFTALCVAIGLTGILLFRSRSRFFLEEY